MEISVESIARLEVLSCWVAGNKYNLSYGSIGKMHCTIYYTFQKFRCEVVGNQNHTL